MFSRRRFLQAGTITAGAGLAAFTPVAPRGGDAVLRSLPPSIASLKSMKDQAKPITAEERAARQEKARQLMEAQPISTQCC